MAHQIGPKSFGGLRNALQSGTQSQLIYSSIEIWEGINTRKGTGQRGRNCEITKALITVLNVRNTWAFTTRTRNI